MCLITVCNTVGEPEKDEKIKKKKQIKQPFRVVMDTVPDPQLFKKGRVSLCRISLLILFMNHE